MIHMDGVTPDQIRCEQRKDEGLTKLFRLAETGEETVKGRNVSKFVIENEILKRKSVTQCWKWEVIRSAGSTNKV